MTRIARVVGSIPIRFRQIAGMLMKLSNASESVKDFPIRRFRDGVWTDTNDILVVEEPLEIRLSQERFTVTMRTPGNDFELTRGLLLTEGVIGSEADIGQIRYCDTGEAADAEIANIVTVQLKTPLSAARRWQRTLMAGTSCGLCGKAALEAVAAETQPLPESSMAQASPTKRFSRCRILFGGSRRCFSRPAVCTPSVLFDHHGKLSVRV